MGLYRGAYGADAKQQNAAADAKREDWRNGAWGAFGDTGESESFRKDLDSRMAAIAGRTAPSVSGPSFGADAYTTAAKAGPAALAAGTKIDRSGELAARAQQQNALSMLAAQAAGKGPSVAGAQMGQSVDAALAAGNAAVASAPRSGSGLAARTAALGQGQMLAGAATQSAATKMQEALQGSQQFASLAAGMRGADINAALGQAKLDQETGIANAGAQNAVTMANAGFAQQAGMFNANAAQTEAEMRQKAELANVEAVLRSRGMNDAAIQQYLAAYQKQFNLDKQAKMAFWQQAQDMTQFEEKMRMQKELSDQQADAATNAALAQMMMMMAASDKRQKTDVRPADEEIHAFLSAVKPYSYRYKDTSVEGTAPGRHISPMAQDIESTHLGRDAVETGADGVKRVNYGHMLGTIVAAQSYLNKRLDEIESKG